MGARLSCLACFDALAQFKVVALLNDSVGTLAGGAYEDPNVRLGIILGTGTNACYVERVANLGALDPEVSASSRPEMMVNTEWGNFWAGSLPITRVRTLSAYRRWLARQMQCQQSIFTFSLRARAGCTVHSHALFPCLLVQAWAVRPGSTGYLSDAGTIMVTPSLGVCARTEVQVLCATDTLIGGLHVV